MSKAIIREAIDLLLQEAYEGPPREHQRFFVSDVPESSLLGTARHLSVEQAWSKPYGVAHSVAEHVQHLIFSMDVGMQYAHGRTPDPDWEQSWDVGPPDEGHWCAMQRQLRELHLRTRMWVHADEPFEKKESIAGFIGSVAHAAYHLGAIRQLAAIVQHGRPLAARSPQVAQAR